MTSVIADALRPTSAEGSNHTRPVALRTKIVDSPTGVWLCGYLTRTKKSRESSNRPTAMTPGLLVSRYALARSRACAALVVIPRTIPSSTRPRVASEQLTSGSVERMGPTT